MIKEHFHNIFLCEYRNKNTYSIFSSSFVFLTGIQNNGLCLQHLLIYASFSVPCCLHILPTSSCLPSFSTHMVPLRDLITFMWTQAYIHLDSASEKTESIQHGTGAEPDCSLVQHKKPHRSKSTHTCLTTETGGPRGHGGGKIICNKWFWENYSTCKGMNRSSASQPLQKSTQN